MLQVIFVSDRCYCLPSSSGDIHRCLCRTTLKSLRATHSNCFCSFTNSQLSEQCSWQDADSAMLNSTSHYSEICSCHTEAPSMSPSCSWQESPVPYGKYAALDSSTSGFCQPHGQPLIWQQNTWLWPMTSSSEEASPVSWSWRMEHRLDGQRESNEGETNGLQSQASVRWMWPKHDGFPGVGSVSASGKPWSWSETAIANVGSLQAASWEWREVDGRSGDTSWAGGMPWRRSPQGQQSVECRWRGQLSAGVVWWSHGQLETKWQNGAEWNNHQPRQPGGGAWPQWSSGAWGSNWQQVEWNWADAEKASDLWRQASNVSWSQRGWDRVDGWSWAEVSSGGRGQRGPTSAVSGWPTGDGAEWVTLSGWRCDNNRLIITEWQPSRSTRPRHERWQGVRWQDAVSSETKWAWDQRTDATV